MKEYIERSEQESILKKRYYELAGMRPDFYAGYMTAFHIIENDIPNAADVIEPDRLGRVGRLMLPYKGCPRGPIGRLGMAGGKTQDKKAILIEELCCMDTFKDVDGNVWRAVQEEVLQEVIEILRAQSTVLTVEGKTIIIKEYPDDFDANATVGLRWFNDEKNQYEGVYATCQYNILTVREMLKITEELFRTVNKEE